MFTPDKEKTITKDRLVGMQVIDAEGNLVGTVRDVGFTIGKQGISIYVETSKGETKTVPWDDIQGAGDFVVLKGQHQIQQNNNSTSNDDNTLFNPVSITANCYAEYMPHMWGKTNLHPPISEMVLL